MRTSLASLVVALLSAQIAEARVEVRTLEWNELSGAVANRVATVHLTRGIRLTGAILEVGQDSLRMAIHSTSDKKSFPPGEASVWRKDIAEIRIKRVTGPARLAAAAGCGTAAGLGAGKWALSESRVNVSDNSRAAQWAVITAGAVAGGYWLGRVIDTKETVIRINNQDGR